MARRFTLRRSLGQFVAQVSSTFDPSAILAQTTNYASQAQAVASAASSFVSSSSDAQRALASHTMIEASNLIIPGAGTALDLLLQQLPQAHAGAGTCANPPSEPLDRSWPNYVTYEQGVSSYPTPAPGSFEQFVDQAIVQNWELQNNCYWDKASPYPLVLATAIDAWNKLHAPTVKRTITRSTAMTFGTSEDPIAFALTASLPACGPGFFGTDTSCWPPSMSFTINDGPIVVAHPILLHFGPAAKPLAPPGAPVVLHFGPAGATANTWTGDFAWWIAGVGVPRSLGPWARVF